MPMPTDEAHMLRCEASAHEARLLIFADELDRLARHIRTLRSPFRNADKLDWDHLFKMIPDSGHGKFWKEVMIEMRGALELTAPPKDQL